MFSSLNPTEVHLIKNLLESEGITSIIKGEHRSVLLGEVPVDDARVELLVKSQDEDRALDCIQMHSHATRPDWRCAHCEESNPGSFELCWCCGIGRIHLRDT